ncbi:DNA-binding MarR family transcriptional regulator [Hamadaea flava]|uniref:MarR family winged helix-turn-helix transcriptional regulator n=1 Tax=Hamadaea flava TaxID=1742688 RepID=A0ABV8LNV4_9ACTN|nr:MarR family transcriptional regulator [Hamadaea flava]MCP2323913.1 DNA-binding MarR family transcriptional regulator [Hamadaea flava]
MNRRHEALNQLIEFSVLMNEDMTTSLGRAGLTPSRTHVLWELAAAGPMSQRQLAERLKVSARTVTGLIDGLVATGFVTREPHPSDRRAFLVTFTEQGRRTATALEKGQADFAELLFGDMDGKRFDQFTAGLAEVLERFKHGLATQTWEAS